MRKLILTAFGLMFLISFCVATALAAGGGEDTDTRFVNARVVEVNDHHISIIARSGVEHVIAIDGEGTRVSKGEKVVSLKDVRVGDLITIELDEEHPIKLARSISVAQPSDTQVARNPRRRN